MRKRFTPAELCTLAEVELSPEEEWSTRYKEWKDAELCDLWSELKRVENSYLRRLRNRKQQVEKVVGVRLNVRIPRAVIQPPSRIAQTLQVE